MKALLAALTIAAGAFAALSPPTPALADAPREVYQVQCMAELDVFEIRLLDLADETKRQLIERNDKAYAKARGLFVPDLYAHLDLDPADPRYGIEQESFECDMVSGRAVLTAHPEPVAGFATSAAVTITLDDYLVVDDVPFRHCAGGAPLTGLTYAESATDYRIKLAGQVNEQEPWVFRADYGVRWVREPVLRPDSIGYEGIDYEAHEWRQFEDCRYQGPGAPQRRLEKSEIRLDAAKPPPLGEREMPSTTRSGSRSYAKLWEVKKLYQISCQPDFDFFEVRRLDVSGTDTPHRARAREEVHPEESYNLYVPDWHQSAYIAGPLDPAPDPEKPETVLDSPPAEFDCELSTGRARLLVWPSWLNEREGYDIVFSLWVADRLLANLVHLHECAFVGRLSYRAADRSFTLDGYPPTDRFVEVEDERMGLIDASIGAPTYGQHFAVFGEDPQRILLNRFYSCRYLGPSSRAWGSGLY